MMALPLSKRVVATVENNLGAYPMNTFHAVGDVNGDGQADIVVSGRTGRMVWLENRGMEGTWPEHLIDPNVDGIECGGSLVDLTGNGYLDVIVGSGGGNDEIWWWENPGPGGGAWIKRTILKTGARQFHDTLIGDALNDGRRCLVFTNQHGPGGTTVYCIPLPKDPRVTPWPEVMIVAQGLSEELVGPDGRVLKMQPEEGIAIGDVDGDGENELVCGTHWLKRVGAGWRASRFARGYVTTKIAIADVDGDGRNEILLAEGDPCIYGKTQGGKVAWFKPGADVTATWEEHVLEEGLLDAHTLVAADLRGSGAIDVIVGEIGVASETRGYKIRPPRLLLYANDGRAHFTREVLDEGTGIHDGVLADMRGIGRLDLVGKPLHGAERWHVHVYYNGRDG
ncbi:MAG: VCBS repeat-containing protein [Anaerolineae bacterium]|nr:VCBS repeat-containing protein [Anaerolineae bacterium]